MGLTVEAALTASPAFAAGTYTCTTPASGGTCGHLLHRSGQLAEHRLLRRERGERDDRLPGLDHPQHRYPARRAPSRATTTTSTPPCTQSTSGSGTTEHYILTCPLTDNPSPSQTGSYPVTFIANPGTDGGTATVSGTDTITVSNTTQACIAPASGGTSTTWAPGLHEHLHRAVRERDPRLGPGPVPEFDRHRLGRSSG